ncbi:TonB-dependent receptor plug domain-containing protein [Puia sp. P3]|uniref:TonB-dependent receptor plug domain-containing protein n=1 Tax=Puia sp. P3 TaxID=3423952 RepID=UPI003D6646AB
MSRQNLDGSFVLKGISKDAVLLISYTGYKTEELSLRGRNDISLAMTINPKSLNEIVVIGYGMVRKRDLTGSVSQVKPAEVTSYPTNNIVNALQGRATGVVVQQNNGAPGGAISVRIRGTNSILGGNEPLYVIDGFPYSGNPVFLQNRGYRVDRDTERRVFDRHLWFEGGKAGSLLSRPGTGGRVKHLLIWRRVTAFSHL